MKRNYLVAILLLLVFVGYFHEYIFYGQDASIRVHDNLDSDVIYRHHLVKEGAIFAGPLDEVRPMMDGLPRVCLPSGLNIMVWLYWLFGTLGGFIASEFLVHILAYVGVYVLLKNHFLQDDKHFWLRHAAALLFATMPFFPVTGGAAAMQPLLLNAFLNIRNSGRWSFKDLVPVILYPFYSSFVWVGIFVLIFLGAFSLYHLYKVGIRKAIPFVGAIALLTGLMVVADYQLFMVFFSPESFFVSHRVNFQVELNYNLKGVMVMGAYNAASGIYHSAVYAGFVFVLAPLIALVTRLVQRQSIFGDKLIFLLAGIFGFLGLMTTLWFWEKLGALYGPGSLLTQINISRFHYLLPLSGLILAVYAMRMVQAHWTRFLIAGLMVVGVGVHFKLYHDMHHYAPGPNRENWFAHMTYRQYYSTDVFGEVKQACDQRAGTKDYNVLGFGIQSAVLQYNGFNTLDSYQNFYPLEYEQAFMAILEPELAKCEDLRKDSRFRIHNNCYVVSCETYHTANKEEMDFVGPVKELALDPAAIVRLRGRFIVSRWQVLDFGTDRIHEVAHYAHPGHRAYKDVYIYEVL